MIYGMQCRLGLKWLCNFIFHSLAFCCCIDGCCLVAAVRKFVSVDGATLIRQIEQKNRSTYNVFNGISCTLPVWRKLYTLSAVYIKVICIL